jgi:2',3'-cyclic-nucleotide 2'-phosphodiesterase/3'-nucleotidase
MGCRAGILATTTVVLLLLAAPPGPAAPAETRRLTLLHTSDVHGAVLPFDDVRNRPTGGSLAQVVTMVEDLRSTLDHPVLLLDSGDAIQGSPLELFGHVRWSEPSPTITAMNRAGYLAMAVGNHEFNFGLEVLEKARRQADFPFLSANVVDAASGEPAFVPYLVEEINGIRVGILGLTTPNIPGWELPEHYRGLAFEPPDDVARHWVGRLRGEEGCDLVVVLAHTGFERDPVSGRPGDTAHEDFGWRLSEVDGIDVLLTGHAHDNIPPRRLNRAIVAQPSSRARVLTRIDLELVAHGEGWRVAAFEGANLPVADVPPDDELVRRLEPLHQRVVAALDGPVGELQAPLDVAGCRLADCAALDLVHAVQLQASGAELSLAAILSDNAPRAGAGEVSWRWVHGFYVYPNTLVAVRLSGAQVKDILEWSARYYDGLDCGPDGGCTVLTDPSIPHYNVDTMAGLSYRIDPTRPEGDRVRDLRRDGRPLDLHRSYTVVCNNYRAAGGGHYPHLAAAEIVWRSPTEMSELIGDFLARQRPWPARADGNWLIAPDISGERALPGGG